VLSASGDVLVGTDLALVRGGRLLFETVSFRVARGEALLVTGPNGAGKSSLLRLVAGLLEPAGGTLANPFSIGWQAGEPALKPDRLLGSELAYWAALDAAPPAAVQGAAVAMAIDSLLDLPCAMLSAGQRQRAALARVIASGAPLWLLDEPTNALDAASEIRLLRAIASHREQGGLVVAATHHALPVPGAAHLSL